MLFLIGVLVASALIVGYLIWSSGGFATRPAGYYVDGGASGEQRAWDGQDWVSDAEQLRHEPLAHSARPLPYLLGALVLTGLVRMFLNVRDIDRLRDFRSGDVQDAASRATNISRWLETVGQIDLSVQLLTAGLFLVWLARAYRNLRSMRGVTRYSVNRALISWFIPVVNLWVPFRTMRELATFVADPPTIKGLSTVTLATWWALYLLSDVGALALLSDSGDNIDVWIVRLWLAVVVDALMIGAALLAIVMVTRITRYQDSCLPPAAASEPDLHPAA